MSDKTPNEREIIIRFSNLMRKMNIAIILFILVAIWLIAGGPDFIIRQDKNPNSTSEKEITTASNPHIDSKIIDEETGLIMDANLEVVVVNCIACHSAHLITYTSADSSQWHDMIKWMQQTQGLWDLGNDEKSIIEYLSQHYGPSNRQNQSEEITTTWHEID
jgi:hypothetical protein